MANGHGGRRPGAGRKPKAERFASKIAAAEKRIADRLPDLVDRLFELADGVTIQKTDSEGGVDIYTQPPNIRALVYLVDRILGKPLPEPPPPPAEAPDDDFQVDLSAGPGGGPEDGQPAPVLDGPA
jgi:hypothetical protein